MITGKFFPSLTLFVVALLVALNVIGPLGARAQRTTIRFGVGPLQATPGGTKLPSSRFSHGSRRSLTWTTSLQRPIAGQGSVLHCFLSRLMSPGWGRGAMSLLTMRRKS
jgi:hypothetical protein